MATIVAIVADVLATFGNTRLLTALDIRTTRYYIAARVTSECAVALRIIWY